MSTLFADSDSHCAVHTIRPDPLLWLQLEMEDMMDNLPLSQRVALERAKPLARLECVLDGRPCDVYIGGYRCVNKVWLAATKWSNPFEYKGNGGLPAVAVARYEAYLKGNKELLAMLPELRGKVLGCTCPRWQDAPCRGELLVRLVNRLASDLDS